MGLSETDPTFDGRLEAAYAAAVKEGLWKGKYAGRNHHEYFAEGVQSWFDTNRENDFEHNHVDTREELQQYDPRLAKLVKEVFGSGPWRYRHPQYRQPHSAHLAGFDRAKAPVFGWAEKSVAWYDRFKEGLETLAPGNAVDIDLQSPKDRAPSFAGFAEETFLISPTPASRPFGWNGWTVLAGLFRAARSYGPPTTPSSKPMPATFGGSWMMLRASHCITLWHPAIL